MPMQAHDIFALPPAPCLPAPPPPLFTHRRGRPIMARVGAVCCDQKMPFSTSFWDAASSSKISKAEADELCL